MTMATVAAYAALAAAAVGAYSSYSSGQAAKAQAESQADYQTKMANYNAQVQENNAASIRDQTSAKEDAQRRMVRIQQGKERASIAQSGLSATGSLLDVYDQNAVFNELDILNTRYAGEMEARGLAAQSQVTRWQGATESGLSRAQGKNAQTAGYIGAASSLLNGASSYYGMKAKAK